MTPTIDQPAPIRRRRRRGAALAEALIMLPAFFAIWTGVNHLTGVYQTKMINAQRVREATWRRAMKNCVDAAPPGVTVSSQDVLLPPDSEHDAVDEIDALGQAVPFFEVQARPLFGHADEGRASASYTKPTSLGGGSGTLEHATSVSCNEEAAGQRWEDLSVCREDGEQVVCDDLWYVFVEVAFHKLLWELDPCQEGLTGSCHTVGEYCASDPEACFGQ
jgi:hypothetical protein